MAGFRLNSGRVGLLFAVLLVSAIAVANCDVIVANESKFSIQVFDITSHELLSADHNNTESYYAWSGPEDKNGTVLDTPHVTFLQYYTVEPNTTANATAVSGNTNVLAIANVRNNATITFSVPSGASGAGRIALSLQYS